MRSRSTVCHLVDLGEALMVRYGDRVKNWITINEPTIYAYSGYGVGEFPPAHYVDLCGAFHSIHHMNLAHSLLCEVCSAHVSKGNIGMAHHYLWMSPADPSRDDDREAAELMDDVANGTVLDVLHYRRYPQRFLRHLAWSLPRRFEQDLRLMRPGTYQGINYYTRYRARYRWFVPFIHNLEYTDRRSPHTAEFEIYPSGIYNGLLRIKERYRNPVIVLTETGFASVDKAGCDPLDDENRIAYLADHLALLKKAVEKAVDCRGFFVWSLLDNFEWNWGLSMRAGLLRTDFKTMKRTWKKSAYWYHGVVTSGRLDINTVPPIDPDWR